MPTFHMNQFSSLNFLNSFFRPRTPTNPAAATVTRAPHPSPQEPHEPVHAVVAVPVNEVPTVNPAAPIPVEIAVIFFFEFVMIFFIIKHLFLKVVLLKEPVEAACFPNHVPLFHTK